jgi:hypothetical protein
VAATLLRSALDQALLASLTARSRASSISASARLWLKVSYRRRAISGSSLRRVRREPGLCRIELGHQLFHVGAGEFQAIRINLSAGLARATRMGTYFERSCVSDQRQRSAQVARCRACSPLEARLEACCVLNRFLVF